MSTFYLEQRALVEHVFGRPVPWARLTADARNALVHSVVFNEGIDFFERDGIWRVHYTASPLRMGELNATGGIIAYERPAPYTQFLSYGLQVQRAMEHMGYQMVHARRGQYFAKGPTIYGVAFVRDGEPTPAEDALHYYPILPEAICAAAICALGVAVDERTA